MHYSEYTITYTITYTILYIISNILIYSYTAIIEHAYYQTIGCLLSLSNTNTTNTTNTCDGNISMSTSPLYGHGSLTTHPTTTTSTIGIDIDIDTRYIYVLGDSHTLPLAWHHHTSNTPNTPNILFVPRLVTGVKHWHLRDFKYQDKHGKSLPITSAQKHLNQFYPKVNFNQVVASIPMQSEVLLLIGEIDCREGILTAVEKGQYTTIVEGIECVIDIAINSIKTIIKSKQIKSLYIHPVLPILNETRPLVMEYNHIYRQKIEKAAIPNVYWLDFVDILTRSTNASTTTNTNVNINTNTNTTTTSSSSSSSSSSSTQCGLVSDYKLDGTHINPTKYIPLVINSINQVTK